jgi:hypothetical protein
MYNGESADGQGGGDQSFGFHFSFSLGPPILRAAGLTVADRRKGLAEPFSGAKVALT